MPVSHILASLSPSLYRQLRCVNTGTRCTQEQLSGRSELKLRAWEELIRRRNGNRPQVASFGPETTPLAMAEHEQGGRLWLGSLHHDPLMGHANFHADRRKCSGGVLTQSPTTCCTCQPAAAPIWICAF